MMRRIGGVLAILLSAAVPLATAEVSQDLDADSGLARWHFRDGALSLELIQRLPDQTRAFFLGRGFDADSADRFARACVFQAIVRNATPAGAVGPALAIDLGWWRVERGDVPLPLPLESEWQQRWSASGQSKRAQIAFRWALIPTQQVFQPGDYNWGMIALGPAPGSEVGLDLVWHENGQPRQGGMQGVRCPPDETVSDQLGDER